MENRKDELDRFKSEINLGEYACAMHGFTFDKRQSSRCSAVVRHANGDKLIITRRPNQHYVYFNAKGEGKDSGTILDFIQARSNISFGKIRQLLREWSPTSSNHSSTKPTISIEPSKHDAARVLSTWVKTDMLKPDNPYLVTARSIPPSTFTAPIFRGQIRTDLRRNILFAHRTNDGDLCGFEIKNKSFTGFSPGGVKSLFRSALAADATTAVFCETAIDLLSVATIFGMQHRQFFSTAGQVSESQLVDSVSVLKSMPALERVWLAFDNDKAGHELAKQFEDRITNELSHIDVQVTLPKLSGSDWNDELRSIGGPTSDPAP